MSKKILIIIIVLIAIWFLWFKNSPSNNQNKFIEEKIEEFVLRKEGVDSKNQISIGSVSQNDWPNSCFGLEEEGEFCAQVITPGYRVVVELKDGSTLSFRTNSDLSIIREE